mmetsp:Transcript_80549/g.195261  ORF Transcript_80549/g.195261 Transcript_80549/m.195261 type:complete len:128 (+) Transcript_80549:70-453(+)
MAVRGGAGGKTAEPDNTYVIRPSYKQKFPVGRVKETMAAVMREKLGDSKYDTEATAEIAHQIREKLKELKLPRYKFMVQVVMGERKGEGVRMGCRCFWDNDTDNYASETFVNDDIFCVASAFAVYLY